jgi:hypothetical protein
MSRFFLILYLALVFPVFAQETMIRQVHDPVTDTHVEVLALFTKPSPGGYFPVRIKIANNLTSERTIRLDFESTSNYSDELRTASSFNFTTAAGKTLMQDIMVPLNPPHDDDSGINISATLSGSLGQASNSIRSTIGKSVPASLLSETLFTPHASALDKEINTKLASSSGSSLEFAAKFDAKQLPNDWLAFSGYDSVIMTDTDWSDVPPGARNAILSWVRLGGQLLIYSSSRTTLAALGLPAEAGFGSISTTAPTDDTTLIPEIVTDVLENTTQPRHSSINDNYQTNWPLQKKFGGQVFRYSFFVIVMICFGILVGPVNLFVFAKAGKRHRLFITTPLISLATSLVLIGLILTLDGFGGSGTRRVLMEVCPDSGVNAAYIHQEQFSRTGVLTGADFTIHTPAVFQPVKIAGDRLARFTGGSGAKGAFNLQPADGKLVASGDWFQSRSEHGQTLSAVIPTRGRIEQTDVENTLVSTFEFPIETLYYRNETGQCYRAEAIEAGKPFTLTAVETALAMESLAAEEEAFAPRNQHFLAYAKGRPSHFIAITRHAPGIDTLPGIQWKETRTVITGPVVAKD